MTKSPETVLSKTDPGDDVQRRFRYQAKKAAMLALSLLDDEAEVQEVYCEHHEDILVRKKNHRLIGYQVKTKFDDADPHKAIDEEIVRSIRRFVELERQYGKYFDRYVIGSNAGFWNGGPTTSSLPYILNLVKEAKGGNLPAKALSFLKKIFPKPKKQRVRNPPETGKVNKSNARVPSENTSPDPEKDWKQTIEHGKTVLEKLSIETLPSMRDMRGVLIGMLPSLPEIGNRLYFELGKIADDLIAETLRAGALAEETARDGYLAVFNNPASIKDNAILAGKCITKEKLAQVLLDALPIVPTLRTKEPLSVEDLPNTMSILKLKMDAGSLSIDNIALAKDLMSSTELLLTQWLHRYGKKVADARYQHLRTLVRTECQEAFDHTQTQDRCFGREMLEEIRRRLRSRHSENPNTLFGISYEHLIGMVGILTEDCTIWWSQKFDIAPHENAR